MCKLPKLDPQLVFPMQAKSLLNGVQSGPNLGENQTEYIELPPSISQNKITNTRPATTASSAATAAVAFGGRVENLERIFVPSRDAKNREKEEGEEGNCYVPAPPPPPAWDSVRDKHPIWRRLYASGISSHHKLLELFPLRRAKAFHSSAQLLHHQQANCQTPLICLNLNCIFAICFRLSVWMSGRREGTFPAKWLDIWTLHASSSPHPTLLCFFLPSFL